jgi:hypothetical protein
MKPTSLLQLFAQQARALWCSSSAVSNEDDNVDIDHAIINDDDFTALEQARTALLESEGRVASLQTDGYYYPSGGPTLLDVIRLASLHTTNGFHTRPPMVLWAPTQEQADAAKAWYRPMSVCMVPYISSRLMSSLAAVVPADLWPREGDTRESLVARISQSRWLDDAHGPLKGRGKGGRVVRLNASQHRQPRRASRSVRGSPEFSHRGEDVQRMFHYSAFRRAAQDAYATPMSAAEMDLSTAVWLAARHWLSPISAACPFNQCQVLLYYEALQAHMRPHRDNNSKKTFLKMLAGQLPDGFDAAGTCTGIDDTTCQVPGSCVCVFSIGTKAMLLRLRYAHQDKPHQNMEDYVIHPTFCIPLGPGTLFVLHPQDDVWMTHEAIYELEPDEEECNGVRIAFVLRHCQKLLPFTTSASRKHQRIMDSEVIATQQKLRAQKRARAMSASRRMLMKRMF